MAYGQRFKYEDLSAHIIERMEAGFLGVGMKLPSLREIAKQTGTSVTTAMQAYRQLEDQGVIEARPQSGYYVASQNISSLGKPRLSKPIAQATHVAKSGAIHTLLRHASNPDLVPLGCAIPSADVLASGQLDKFLSRAARTKGIAHNLYTEPHGDLLLRSELARRALRWGQVINTEDIAITAGCTEALFLALRSVTKPGDMIAIESPAYFGILQVAELLGLKIFELSTHADHGVEINSLEEALDGYPIKACLLSSSFSNPLGCIVPEDKKREILNLLYKKSVTLIEDDVYGDIHFGDDRPKPYMALESNADVIYCSSLSKTLAPGYRVGWIISNTRMQHIVEQKLALTLSGPALPQAAIANYLQTGGYDNHLRRIRRIFENTIQTMLAAIMRSFPNDTRVSRPTGGFVLWIELPKKIDSRVLFKTALANGICFVPGNAFTSGDAYNHCLRLSAGCKWDDNISDAIKTLGQITHDMLNDECRS